MWSVSATSGCHSRSSSQDPGATVLGLDIDQAKVDQINSGRSYIKHIAAGTINEALQANRLTASTDFSRVKEVKAVIICVPTPLNKNREPDTSFILETGRAIAPHGLQRGYYSGSSPWVARERCRPVS